MECVCYRLDSTERRNVQCSPESRCYNKTYKRMRTLCVDNKCNHADWPGTHLLSFSFNIYLGTNGALGPNGSDSVTTCTQYRYQNKSLISVIFAVSNSQVSICVHVCRRTILIKCSKIVCREYKMRSV